MRPSLLVCLPVRGQATAGAAVRAILADCPEAQVFVYHNYVDSPVSLDLPPGVLLVEERVPATMTIGAIRNWMCQMALARSPWAVASADADITGFLQPGYYRRVLAALERAPATAARRYVELAGLEGNVNLLLLAVLSNAQSYLRSRMGSPTTTVGAGSAFRAEALLAAGGYPDVAVGEDLAMADRMGSVETLQDDGVYCDCRKLLSHLDDHYDRWAERVNLPPGPPPPADRLIEGGVAFMSSWIAQMFSLAIRATGSSALQLRAAVFHERLQTLALRLPGLAPAARLGEVADFHRSPLG